MESDAVEPPIHKPTGDDAAAAAADDDDAADADDDDDDDADAADDAAVRRKLRQEARARLIAHIADLNRIIHKPLHHIIRDHALPHLPSTSLLRFRSVSSTWNRLISSPLFTHTQTRTHRSTSGLFFHPSPADPPSFAPFDPNAHSLPDPSLSFLPHSPVTVRSSSNGLLCCLTPFSTYLICNPTTTQWTSLPEPTLDHGSDPNLVLVFNPSVYNFGCDYFLVSAFKIGGESGPYGFETFSSASGEWRISAEICPTEEMIPGSGISAGGVAYWRTTIQTVVGYDPTADKVRVVTWPMGYTDDVTLQLGEMDGRLCCVLVTASALTVHALGPSDRWAQLRNVLVAGYDGWWWGGTAAAVLRQRPWPLRFQSANLEVMVWADGRAIELDLASRRARDVSFREEQPECDVEYVAHINTLAPVVPQATPNSSDVGPTAGISD